MPAKHTQNTMHKTSFGFYIISLICLFLLCSFAKANSEHHQVIMVPANSEAGFEYPYYLRIPKTPSNLEKRYLIVETNNSGVNTDFTSHIEKVRIQILGQGPGPMVAADLMMPLLIPVFPRGEDGDLVYTHALDRDTMKIKGSPSERLDLQLLSMVMDARTKLASRKLAVEERFVMVGFSASGTFSNRFAFLHPSKLLAVSSGAVNSMPMLPVTSIRETNLIYPIGISDFKEITGNEFDRDSWVSLPQMIYMGAADDNDTLKFMDAFSDHERKIVIETVGENMAQRWSKSQIIYLGNL